MDELALALTNTGLKFAHFGWSKAPAGDYGVYAEDGANDLVAGNVHVEKVLQGTVDYFTRDATGAAKATIEAALESVPVAYYLGSVQFESDSGYIHYEWVFECGEN
jgi:hypothetical protein